MAFDKHTGPPAPVSGGERHMTPCACFEAAGHSKPRPGLAANFAEPGQGMRKPLERAAAPCRMFPPETPGKRRYRAGGKEQYLRTIQVDNTCQTFVNVLSFYLTFVIYLCYIYRYGGIAKTVVLANMKGRVAKTSINICYCTSR
jgi:hypothetical protein